MVLKVPQVTFPSIASIHLSLFCCLDMWCDLDVHLHFLHVISISLVLVWYFVYYAFPELISAALYSRFKDDILIATKRLENGSKIVIDEDRKLADEGKEGDIITVEILKEIAGEVDPMLKFTIWKYGTNNARIFGQQQQREVLRFQILRITCYLIIL